MPLFGPRLHRWLHGELPVWYHPDYRLPVPALEHLARRAGMVAEWLLEAGIVGRVREPERIDLERVGRVHHASWMEALTRPEALTSVFGMPVPVDSVLDTVRRAAGGTLAATQVALTERRATLNLLGGFHHASPDRGHGFSPLNDLAVAAREVVGRVGVLDLDAHPPDGTAACLHDAWIGSISGTTWDPLENVDNTVIFDADDSLYLAALDRLLARMPRCDCWFVVAGGDVLDGDPIGHMRLSLAGVRERDRRVHAALDGLPAVWLPAGGYSGRAWRAQIGRASCRERVS
jgi:acetoin utilization deacetylase AcuC-like enzyme